MEKKIKLETQKGKKEINHWDHFKTVVEISALLNQAANEHYRKNGLQYVEVPEIVGVTGACENIDTLFKVGNRLTVPLFFTQTGQLALEQALQKFNGVYSIIHSGRDEEIEDERHLRQFRLTEEEFDCQLAGMKRETYNEEKMYEALLSHIEQVIKAMVKMVVDTKEKELKDVYDRNLQELRHALENPFRRILYEDAIKLLNQNGYPDLKFGDDLKADHEQKIVNLLAKGKVPLPTFIMCYPKEIKFFNMKVSDKDDKVVLSADLVFPFSGEGVGSAVREHRGDHLKRRLLDSNMYQLHTQRGGKYDDFKWYVDDIIIAGKTNPHAGYGVGNERVLQYILGLKDIRSCSLFFLMAQETNDWNLERRNILAKGKKAILLSIGKEENKKKLLPFVKKISEKNYLLFVTENTHKFLKKNKIETTLVYKISQVGQEPNLIDLLRKKQFDLIVNIPTGEKKDDGELTDGRLIRKMAVQTDTDLVTDTEVAECLLEKLART